MCIQSRFTNLNVGIRWVDTTTFDRHWVSHCILLFVGCHCSELKARRAYQGSGPTLTNNNLQHIHSSLNTHLIWRCIFLQTPQIFSLKTHNIIRRISMISYILVRFSFPSTKAQHNEDTSLLKFYRFKPNRFYGGAIHNILAKAIVAYFLIHSSLWDHLYKMLDNQNITGLIPLEIIVLKD